MLLKKIQHHLSTIDINMVTEERKVVLQPLIEFIQKKLDLGEQIRISFICTHNSRRSLLAQVWAQTLAHHFNLKNVFCYSGGTESTSLFPKVAEVLKKVGFKVKMLSKGKNPIYCIHYSKNEHPVVGFSKEIDHDFNPESCFAAIMTCSQVEKACPFVPGAETQIPITYKDPKEWDNSPNQTEKYIVKSQQIATEMFYVFSQIKS